MFKIKFPTKRIFRIFHILRINGMTPFCNLFMERPLYLQATAATHLSCGVIFYLLHIYCNTLQLCDSKRIKNVM